MKFWQRVRQAFLAVTLSVTGVELVLARVNVTADTWDVATGQHLGRQQVHNLVVGSGLNLIRDLMYGDAVAGPSHFAVGTSSTAVTPGDTTLGAEVAREALTTRAKGAGKLTVKYYLGSTTANGSTLTEAGLFNAAAAGTMYCRVVLGEPIPKTTAIAVTFTWDLTWGAA
jgi:hypothetical protein